MNDMNNQNGRWARWRPLLGAPGEPAHVGSLSDILFKPDHEKLYNHRSMELIRNPIYRE